jgi:hypothetical protein
VLSRERKALGKELSAEGAGRLVVGDLHLVKDILSPESLASSLKPLVFFLWSLVFL